MRVSVFCLVGLFVVVVFLSLRMKRERDGRVRNTERLTERQRERGFDWSICSTQGYRF